MNDQEHREEENLERLIRAGCDATARPVPSARQQTLRRLQRELRNEYASATRRDERVDAAGQAAAPFDESARRRDRHQPTEQERNTLMSKIFTPWGFGLGAAAGTAAIIMIIGWSAPRTQGKAIDVLAQGSKATAKLETVHLSGKLRTAPRDNFSAIMPEQNFVTIELWKQNSPTLKWRAEKPGRIAVMDGQSTLLFLKPDIAYKVPHPSPSAFDTQWLHQLADLSDTLTQELVAIKAHGWPVALTPLQGADGKGKSVITIEAKSGLPDSDYVKNKFFGSADTRRVYVFDNQSELLESIQVYVQGASGNQLVFELTQIDYNQPIDPSVFQLELPANVTWIQEPQVLPDNAKYAAMTAEQAARAFFEACGRQDWTEAGKFYSGINEGLKQYLGGVAIVNLGTAFTSQNYPGRFIPYEIKLQNGRVKKHNLAIRNDNPTKRWLVDGGI